LTSDRRGQFESALWQFLMHRLGIRHVRTTAYHPAANCMVERLHHQLKASLMAQGSTLTCCQSLPLVLLGIRAAIKENLGHSPAGFDHGETLRLSGEFFADGAGRPCCKSAPRHPFDVATKQMTHSILGLELLSDWLRPSCKQPMG